MHSSVGLIVEMIDGEKAEKEGLAVKKAHAKLHINIAPFQISSSAEFALAIALSTRIISDSHALRKLATIKPSLDKQSPSSAIATLSTAPSSSPSTERIALAELESEIHQIAMSEEVKTAAAADGKTLDIPLLRVFIKMMIRSQYVCMGEKVPKSQPWCVD